METQLQTPEIKLSDESISKLALLLSSITTSQKKWLTVKEAAEYLNCSESGLRGYMKNKKITYYKFNGIILFKSEELDKLIEDNKVESINDVIERAIKRGK